MLCRCNICLKNEDIEHIKKIQQKLHEKNLLGVTLLSAFTSGSLIPFADVFGPTPTTDGISDLGESSY